MKKIATAIALSLIAVNGMAFELQSTLKENIALYTQAWNEKDADNRLELLEQVLSDDFLLVDGGSLATGVNVQSPQAVSDWIQIYLNDMESYGLGDTKIISPSNIDVMQGVENTNQYYRGQWAIAFDGDTEYLFNGVDFGVANEKGEINFIASFFGSLLPICQVPPYVTGEVFNGGNLVTFEGAVYQANWWTNNAPNSEEAINNGEWKYLFDCSVNY